MHGKDFLKVHAAITALSLEDAVGVLNEFGHRNERSWYPELGQDGQATYVRSAVRYEWLTIFEALAIAAIYMRLRDGLGLTADQAAAFQFAKSLSENRYEMCGSLR